VILPDRSPQQHQVRTTRLVGLGRSPVSNKVPPTEEDDTAHRSGDRQRGDVQPTAGNASSRETYARIPVFRCRVPEPAPTNSLWMESECRM